MIVLAVTTGFFAESLRENITEHHQEKEYIISLHEDLHENDSVLTSMIKAHEQNVWMMDTLISLLGQLNGIKGREAELYYFSRIAPRVEILPLTDRTFQQIKSAGNAHVIKDLNAIGRVIKYYNNDIPYIKLEEDLYMREFDLYKTTAAQIFDPTVMRSLELPDGSITKTNGNPSLLNYDIKPLKQLAVFVVYMRGSVVGDIEREKKLQHDGQQLIKYLQEHYSYLKN
jgi:hypothetical protein